MNAIEIKTMTVFRLRTIHSQSPGLILGGVAKKESEDLQKSEVTFDSMTTFEKNLCTASRGASVSCPSEYR